MINFRSTLRETNKHDQSFTPMSVVDLSTPMSIDKSNMEMDHDHSKDTSGSSHRNERERFFEVVEYQKDILRYLKQTEVIITTILCDVEPVITKCIKLILGSKKFPSTTRVHEEATRYQ